jgi:hypothetical protein
MTSLANVILHLMDIKQEVVPKCVDPQYLFRDLCDLSDENATHSISLCPSTSFLHMSHFASIYAYFQYSIRDIPFVLNVANYLQAMSFDTHASFKLRDSNYDNFHIEIVHSIPTGFNGDVLLNCPLLLVSTIILGKCKEWTRNMMGMHGARLR